MAFIVRPRNPTPAAALFGHQDDIDTGCLNITIDDDDDSVFLDNEDNDDCFLDVYMAPVVNIQPKVRHQSRRSQLPSLVRDHTPVWAPRRPRNPTPLRASEQKITKSGRPSNPTPFRANRIAHKKPVLKKIRTTKLVQTSRHGPKTFSRHSSSGFSSCSSPTNSSQSPFPFPYQESSLSIHSRPNGTTVLFSSNHHHCQNIVLRFGAHHVRA